jgi:hypothetical protein
MLLLLLLPLVLTLLLLLSPLLLLRWSGVFESDPWLVLSPYPPFDNTTTTAVQTPQAVLLLSAVNVGPVKLPAGEYGSRDGTVLAPVGSKVPLEAYSYWSKLYGLDFANTWCNASRLWW